MSTITRERLQRLIRAINSENYDEEEIVECVNSDEILELARIALASLEAEKDAEPVAKVDTVGVCWYADNGVPRKPAVGTELYTAPPAPVSVPAAMEIDDDFDSAFEHGKAVGWNAYRAAMLQAEPVSNSDELPLDYLQGHKDGLEWAAQLAEANHPQTGDWLYDDPIELAKAIRKGPDMPEADGNSPVTPGGWVACSERLPENKPGSYEYLVFEELNNGVHHDYWNVPDAGDDCQFTPFWNHYDRYVTHWQPLPSPPAK